MGHELCVCLKGVCRNTDKICAPIGQVDGIKIPGFIDDQKGVGAHRGGKVDPVSPHIDGVPPEADILAVGVGQIKYPGGPLGPVVPQGGEGALVEHEHIFSPLAVELVSHLLVLFLGDVGHDKGAALAIQMDLDRRPCIGDIVDGLEDVFTGEGVVVKVEAIIFLQPP